MTDYEIPTSWKDLLFWPMIVATAVVTLSFTSAIWSRIRMEQPPNQRVDVIIHYAPVEKVALEEFVKEAVVEAVRQGKRSEPGKMSPETQRSIEIQEIFKNGR